MRLKHKRLAAAAARLLPHLFTKRLDISQYMGSIQTVGDYGKCLDIVNNNFANGQHVQLWGCHGGANQNWQQNTGTKLIQAGSANKCLDVPDGNAYNGALVQIWDCDANNRNQKWDVTDGSGSEAGSIKFSGTNYCLDVRNGNYADGTLMQLWTCGDGNKNQRLSRPVSTASQSSNNGNGNGLLNSQTFSGYWVPSWSDFKALHPILYQYNDPLQNAALQYNLPPQILGAIFLQESSANPFVNAAGGFQFTSIDSWNRFSGFKPDRTNIWDAAYAAANYIRYEMDQNGGSLDRALNIYSGAGSSYTDSIKWWMWGHPYSGNL